MSEEIVRCPFCVEDGEFRRMSRQSKKLFLCLGCGHLSSPADTHLRCSCPRCTRMNRIASRISREHPELSHAASS